MICKEQITNSKYQNMYKSIYRLMVTCMMIHVQIVYVFVSEREREREREREF